jgi:K+-sensing histidine kinase KdpD
MIKTPPSLEAKQLARLMDVSLTLNSTLNLDEILSQLLTSATDMLDCDAASILLYDEKRNRLVFAASTGSDPAKLAKIPVPIDGSLAGTIFREEKSIVINDVEQDPRHFAPAAEQVEFTTKSLLGVPMRIRDKGVGVIEALNKRKGQFTSADERLLTALASQAASAIHNARLIQALRNAYENISETDRLKSNFLALASHELRTPLGIIIGYASFLQEEAGEVSEHAERVLAAASQMRSVIEAMTSLHLLQAKGLTFKPRVVPVQQVLNAAYAEMRPIAEEMRHIVTFDLPAQSLLVTADPEKLAPAFVNLLNNAVRFTRPTHKNLPGVLPGRTAQHPKIWRSRHRPDHRQRPDRNPGRTHLGRKRRAGQRHNHPNSAAPRRNLQPLPALSGILMTRISDKNPRKWLLRRHKAAAIAIFAFTSPHQL